jgi:hypothetical protein
MTVKVATVSSISLHYNHTAQCWHLMWGLWLCVHVCVSNLKIQEVIIPHAAWINPHFLSWQLWSSWEIKRGRWLGSPAQHVDCEIKVWLKWGLGDYRSHQAPKTPIESAIVWSLALQLQKLWLLRTPGWSDSGMLVQVIKSPSGQCL